MLLARASLRYNRFPGEILALPAGERAFIYASVDLERQTEDEAIEESKKRRINDMAKKIFLVAFLVFNVIYFPLQI